MTTPAVLQLKWELLSFTDLSLQQLYTILRERQNVFVVEQTCPFPEIDALDNRAWHLLGYRDNRLAAYARILFPGVRFVNPAIGRVITTADFRGQGVGRMLMKEAVRHCCRLFPGRKINLSAQIHLEAFYNEFGFLRISEPYDEDGILHIDMERN